MIDARGVPLLDEMQARQEAAGQQLFLGMYVPLVPQLAVYRLAQGYPSDVPGVREPATPERIAKEAQQIVLAALERIGVVKK